MARRNAKGAETLQRMLDDRGWSATTLQEHTRVTEATVNKWLDGSARPSRSELLVIAGALGDESWDEFLEAYGARELTSVLNGTDEPSMDQRDIPPGHGF